MYAKFAGLSNSHNLPIAVSSKLKQFHHIRLDGEFKRDCEVWLNFLTGPLAMVVNRPMQDLSRVLSATEINFYSDVSASKKLGFGCIFGDKWIFGAWGSKFIDVNEPSIEYLELFALCAGLLTWPEELSNCRIHCILQQPSCCCNDQLSSFVLPELYDIMTWFCVLNGLQFNRRVFVKYVETKSNFLADSLSHLQFDRFRKLGPHMLQYHDKINPSI